MKKIFDLKVFLFLRLFICFCLVDNLYGLNEAIINLKDETASITSIMDILGFSRLDYLIEDKIDISKLNSILQKFWFSKERIGERWEKSLPESISGKEKKLISALNNFLPFEKEIGLLDNTCDCMGVLLLGGAIGSVKNRIDYINKLYCLKKVSGKTPIYVLTGERVLNQAAGETEEAFENIRKGSCNSCEKLEYPKNEEDLMKYMLYYCLDVPEKPNIIFVSSLKDSGHTRATTASTMRSFFKLMDDSGIDNGAFVAISNQPYVVYQQTTIDLILYEEKRNKDFNISVVGNSFNPDSASGIVSMIDSFVKIIYNFNKMSDLQSEK